MSALRNPRVVKIFFSSPFGGMEEEREELTRRYFPSIQHLCNSFGLQFVAVDMRWGITSESSDKAEVINICLREIDRSDMFVGFFGQRYGWHGADDATLQKNFDNALPNYPWLEDVRDKSVTELEFLYGFLNNPGHLPATLYFRNKSYDDKIREEGVSKGDKKQVFKYSAESEHSTHLMDDLKERVCQLKDQSLGVHMDYNTPAEAAKIMYDTIMSYLKDTLLANLSTEKQSARAEMRSQHDAFLASRTDIYVGGEVYIQQLDKKLMSESDRHIVVTGDPGCGMSALLCNWVNNLKQSHDNYVVFYHFIGFAEDSANITRMLMRVVEEFAFVLSQLVDGKGKEKVWESLPTDENEKLRHVTNEILTLVDKLTAYSKTPVLVFDGLEKLPQISKIKKVLYWLPANFPASCFIVVTTKLTDSDNIDELKSRNYSLIELEPLTQEYKRDLCIKVLQKSGKELSTGQLDCIVNASMTRNPLFLRITLSELVAFGYFRLLDQKIQSLISSESTEALFHQVLVRLEEDYNVADYHGNLVEQVLSCIHLSSQGLSEVELKELFSIPDHVWSPLYFAIDNLTINPSGRIQFGFSELGEAVEQKYLQDQDKRKSYINCLIQYYEDRLKELDLSNYVSGVNLPMFRPAYELPPLCLKLEDNERLASCISNYFVFSHLQEHTPYRLVEFWRHTMWTGSQIRDKLLASFDKRVTDLYINMEEKNTLKTEEPPGYKLLCFLEDIETFLNTSGYIEERTRVAQRALAIAQDGSRHQCVHDKKRCIALMNSYKYKVACIYSESYHTAQQGILLHQQLIQSGQSEIDTEGSSQHSLVQISNSYHGIAAAYMTLREFDKVEEVILKSIQYTEISEASDCLHHLAISWNTLGVNLLSLNKFEEAMKYFDKSLEALEKLYVGEDPPLLGEMLTNKGLCLRKLGNLDEAEVLYQRALEVKTKALGREHYIVALSYLNLGSLEAYRKDYETSLKYTLEAKNIFEMLGQTWDNPQYIAVMENIMMQYLHLDKYEEADKDCMTIINWRLKDKSMDRCVPTIYVSMAKYYMREKQFEKAYTLCYALVDSIHGENDGFIAYILLDYACGSLPSKYRDKIPEKFSIQYAAERHPDNSSLVNQLIQGNLVPSNNLDEISRMINIHAEYTDAGARMYSGISEHWCVNPDGEVNIQCKLRVLQDGLIKYPDDLELNLEIGKCYRQLGEFTDALVHLKKIVDTQLDNPAFLFLTADTAILAGDLDVASKWCSYIEQNFSEEQVKTGVNSLKENIEKAKETNENEQE